MVSIGSSLRYFEVGKEEWLFGLPDKISRASTMTTFNPLRTSCSETEMPAIPDPMTQTSVSRSLSSDGNCGLLEYGSVWIHTGSFFPDVLMN